MAGCAEKTAGRTPNTATPASAGSTPRETLDMYSSEGLSPRFFRDFRQDGRHHWKRPDAPLERRGGQSTSTLYMFPVPPVSPSGPRVTGPAAYGFSNTSRYRYV